MTAHDSTGQSTTASGDKNNAPVVKTTPLTVSAYAPGVGSASEQARVNRTNAVEAQQASNKQLGGNGDGSSGPKTLTVVQFPSGSGGPGQLTGGQDVNSTSQNIQQTQVDASVAATGDAAATADPPPTTPVDGPAKVTLSGGKRRPRRRTRRQRKRSRRRKSIRRKRRRMHKRAPHTYRRRKRASTRRHRRRA